MADVIFIIRRRVMAALFGTCKQSVIYILTIYTVLLIGIFLYYVNHKGIGEQQDADFKAKVQESFIKFVEKNLPKQSDTQPLNSLRTMGLNGTSLNKAHAKLLKEKIGEIQKEYIGLKSKKPFNFHCDKCAVVSSSGQLLKSKSGPEIDNSTCVIRMNNAPTVKFESDVGSRTDLRVVCFRSMEFMKEELMTGRSKFDKMVIWGMENHKHKKIKTNFETKFMKKYPDVDYYSLSQKGEDKASKLYEEYLGMSRMKSGTWLSTGWFSIIFAIHMCDSITVYGLPDGDQCSSTKKHPTLYHYYEKRWDECWMYTQHETRLKTGHRYLTEKAVFKQWAQMLNITFKAPSWNLADVNASQPIKSPFIDKMEKLKKKPKR